MTSTQAASSSPTTPVPAPTREAWPTGARNPATGAALPPVTASTPEQAKAAVAASRAAQPAWAALPASEREEAIRTIARRMMERRAEGARVMADETGRSVLECIMSELASIGEYAKAAIRASRRALKTEPIPLSVLDYPGKKARIEAVPRGVIGIIAPWNYPVGNFMKSLMPALLSGNGVVLKPSEHTPRSGAWLHSVCTEVLPEGLVQLVQGEGAVGAALVDGGVDSIVFTGSVRTGKRVAVKAAERLIPCSVELGGKDAAIVLHDCDLDRTALGIAQWGFHNAGQNCAGIERVYVDERIADAFVQKLAMIANRLRVSAGDSAQSELGPVQNAMQLAIVEDHVEEARARGAKVVAGGQRTGNGLGYAATVVDGCTDDMKVARDETFGPVLAVMRFKDEDEAIRRANDSPYGLNGSVWTRDLARGEALARRLDVGVALVNNHAFTGINAELPWTGTKETGYGVAASHHAYHGFVRRRTVLVDSNKNPDPWWFPVDEHLPAFAEALVERQLGSLGALLKLGGLVGKRMSSMKKLVKGQ